MCTVHGTLSTVLAGRYGSSSEIGPLLSENDLKHMYASCDVCWIFPLSYMLLLQYEYLTSTKIHKTAPKYQTHETVKL